MPCIGDGGVTVVTVATVVGVQKATEWQGRARLGREFASNYRPALASSLYSSIGSSTRIKASTKLNPGVQRPRTSRGRGSYSLGQPDSSLAAEFLFPPSGKLETLAEEKFFDLAATNYLFSMFDVIIWMLSWTAIGSALIVGWYFGTS